MFEIVVAALFGLVFGSFLNVCIHRWPRDLSIVRPGSHCTACGHSIRPYDNIPVFSYLLLQGRCRHCRSGIHWRYPLVEALTSILFAVAVAVWGPTPAALKFALFAFLQLGMIFSDLETRLLPDEFTKGGIVLGLIAAVLAPQRSSIAFSLLDAAAGAAVCSGSLWAVGWLYSKIRHKEGLGFGDVKMVAMIGAFLGAGPALMALFLGCLLGSAVGLCYIYLAKKDAASYELPFGSFLGVAAIFVAVWMR